MAFFKPNYSKPGPGVPKDEPPKKGIARFFEIMGRDFGNLLKLNLLVVLCCLLPMTFLLLSIFSILWGSGGYLLYFLLALASGILVGPARTAEAYVISKMLRDDPGFVWHDFKKAFKENFKLSVAPGLLYVAIMGSQVLGFVIFFAAEQRPGIMWAAFLILSCGLTMVVAPYFFAQAPYLDLSARILLKNSLLLGVRNLPRSVAGGVLQLGLLAAQWSAFPATLPVILLLGVSFPALINMMWVWPLVDKTFKIDETLKKRSLEEGAQILEIMEE